MMLSVPCRAGLAVFVLVVFMGTSTASADTASCQRAVAKASARLVQVRAQALGKCRDAVVKTGAGTCPDAKASDAVGKATTKLESQIGRACGGEDRICGGDPTGEDTPTSIGWPARCPNFEREDCRNAIADCADIAACLGCVDDVAVEQAITLTYDDLVLPSSADPILNKCQRAIGSATTAFLGAKSKALQKCWDGRLKGTHAGTCVAPDPGDGKYLAAIAKAETKQRQTICKACGGPDRTCDGIDDLTPPVIGFSPTCPFVTVPSGASCGGSVGDLSALVDCVACVAAFKGECVDRIALPALVPYPSECTGCPAPPATGPCPTTLELTSAGEADVDIGFTGLAHDLGVPAGGRLTLAVSGCAGGSQPTCGQCALSGPITNAGGPAFENQRCQDASWVPCANDGDCISAGAAGPCVFFHGPPEPAAVGGLPFCIVNDIAGPVTGTVDVGTGASAMTLPRVTRFHLMGSVARPCPVCEAGTCSDGPRIGEPCTPSGSTALFGDVSFDCPPDPGSNAGTAETTVLRSTTDHTRTVTLANPTCRGPGFNGGLGSLCAGGPNDGAACQAESTCPGGQCAGRCLCDTCNNANADPCATNADCPMGGGNPGICGGRRCVQGANDGAPCSVSSECAPGSCGRPGEPTRPNTCLDDPMTGIDGRLCQEVGDGEGVCPEGPFDHACSLEPYRPCLTDAECNPPPFPASSCPECLPGQTCEATSRPCFTDNGIVGGTVTAAGSAESPCDGEVRVTAVALYCVPPTRIGGMFNSPWVIAATGLPGLVRSETTESMSLAP